MYINQIENNIQLTRNLTCVLEILKKKNTIKQLDFQKDKT